MSGAADQRSAEAQHRLVDMVVEEVSLVDRAANKRKFLVIKRSGRTGMQNASTRSTDQDQIDTSPPDGALEALEGVAKAVADLAEVATSEADTARLVALATQVGEVAKAILDPEPDADLAAQPDDAEAAAADPSAAGNPEDTSTAGSPPTAAPTAAAGPPVAPTFPGAAADATPSLDATFTKIEAMVRKLRRPAPAASGAPARQTTPSAPDGEASAPLGKLLASIERLTDEVRAQSQRLGRLEKGVGLPGSQADERGPRARESGGDDVSWPLDLNEKLDRASVDKRVSFHDD